MEMPANLSPEYKRAEQAFRVAREPRERLDCLKEMLRTIPRHKGTEHLQADIKSRIRELTDEIGATHTGPAHRHSAHAVRHEGAAQICLIGPPNSGKSTLHAILTGSKAAVGAFPGTTREPLPGMLHFEDIAFQIVDLPPISSGRMEPWMAGLLQTADAAWLVVDLADPECAEQVLAVCAELAQRKITLTDRWPDLPGEHVAEASPGSAAHPGRRRDDSLDPLRTELPTLLVANKSDLDPGADEVSALEELAGVRFPAVAVSATSGQALEQLASFLFRALGIVRVYTKPPGHPPDRTRPFIVRRGNTVSDVARLVHQDVARSLKFARLWGSGAFDGQQVGPDHAVADGDVVELHAR
jgi:ribosome-interacting GTPase 1